MDTGVYLAIVAAFYPLLFGWFLGQISVWVTEWWLDRKRAKRLKEAIYHLAKE
ncbi:hypothetical protein [Corynebacterium sp. sy039]|uniref:hypothetical protein n=1 Tax=Corynebacterium sp. sy039 TaxID=2599641 RepID=UPI00143CFEB8|nr:hypothetical protein [Corynebacterium sp. sy039]